MNDNINKFAELDPNSPYYQQTMDILNSPEHKARMEEQKRKIAEFKAMQNPSPEESQSPEIPQVAQEASPKSPEGQDPRLTEALSQQKKQRLYSDLLRSFQQIVAAGGNIKADTSMADILNQRANEPVEAYKAKLQQEATAKKEAREDQESKLRQEDFVTRIAKSKLDLTDMEANNDPKSDNSKAAQDRTIELREQQLQRKLTPQEEAGIRQQNATTLHRYMPQLQKDVYDIIKMQHESKEKALDREQRAAHDKATLESQNKRLEFEDKRWAEGEARRKDELTRREEKDRKDVEKTFRSEARNVLKDLRATETWKSSEKASNAIDEISPLLEDAYKKGGQSLAMLGPRIAKGIAGEVGVLTERDVTRYVQNPTLVGGIMDTAAKVSQGQLTDVSYENIKRLLEIVKKESSRKREDAIKNEAILFSRRNGIPYEQARTYIDSEFNPQGTQLSSKDEEALKWANDNPDDPRAAKIKERLGK